MRSKVERHSEEAENAVQDIRRATRFQYSAEEKVRIVIASLHGVVLHKPQSRPVEGGSLA
jgi:transposase